MELAVKTFQELTADELYELLRLRAEVFVVSFISKGVLMLHPISCVSVVP